MTGLGKRETWIKTDVTQEFEVEPTLNDIKDMLGDIETILEMEEADERRYWAANKDQSR